jgi:hypothetical protein
VLPADGSAAVRDQLIGEIASLGSAADAAQWARTALASKNSLTAADARLVELAFELRLSAYETGAGAENPAQEPRRSAEEAGRSLGRPEPESSASEPRSRGDAASKPTDADKPACIDKPASIKVCWRAGPWGGQSPNPAPASPAASWRGIQLLTQIP